MSAIGTPRTCVVVVGNDGLLLQAAVIQAQCVVSAGRQNLLRTCMDTYSIIKHKHKTKEPSHANVDWHGRLELMQDSIITVRGEVCAQDDICRGH